MLKILKLGRYRFLFLIFILITSLILVVVFLPKLPVRFEDKINQEDQSDITKEQNEPYNQTSDSTSQLDYSVAVEKAIEFFEDSRDPYALLFLDVIYRRFGILEFKDALSRFDEEVINNQLIAQAMAVFRRIADRTTQPTASDFYEAQRQGDTNIFVIPALYCDRFGLSINYPNTLNDAAKKGGYYLTHVLLACIWVKENGCEGILSQNFVEDIYHTNAELINLDESVTDLELEAAAFLCLADRSELIDNAFVEKVILNQNADGSWKSPDIEKWHSTVLGLILLLHLQYPSDVYPPMLA